MNRKHEHEKESRKTQQAIKNAKTGAAVNSEKYIVQSCQADHKHDTRRKDVNC